MASGRIYGDLWRSYYRIEIDWEADGNAATNSSLVTAKIYLASQYSLVYSATKYGSLTIYGSTQNFSSTANVSHAETGRWQRTLIHTRTYTVGHASDGRRGITISASFNPDSIIAGQSSPTFTASGYCSLDAISVGGKMDVNVGGQWRKGNVYVNVSGTWRQAEAVYVNSGGTWRKSE